MLNILQKSLYLFMLFSVGFLIFVCSNLDLFTDAFSSPCVIHGSRFMYLRVNFILFVGRAVLNALSYIYEFIVGFIWTITCKNWTEVCR